MSRVDDPDNPEWTKDMFRRARPAREVFPNVDFPKPKRGPQKEPTKVQTTVRLDRQVIDHFRAGGPGWQTRLNDVLKKIVEKERRKAG
jgi:uncharacterized protein (DUF4415 family)